MRPKCVQLALATSLPDIQASRYFIGKQLSKKPNVNFTSNPCNIVTREAMRITCASVSPVLLLGVGHASDIQWGGANFCIEGIRREGYDDSN